QGAGGHNTALKKQGQGAGSFSENAQRSLRAGGNAQLSTPIPKVCASRRSIPKAWAVILTPTVTSIGQTLCSCENRPCPRSSLRLALKSGASFQLVISR